MKSTDERLWTVRCDANLLVDVYPGLGETLVPLSLPMLFDIKHSLYTLFEYPRDFLQ